MQHKSQSFLHFLKATDIVAWNDTKNAFSWELEEKNFTVQRNCTNTGKISWSVSSTFKCLYVKRSRRGLGLLYGVNKGLLVDSLSKSLQWKNIRQMALIGAKRALQMFFLPELINKISRSSTKKNTLHIAKSLPAIKVISGKFQSHWLVSVWCVVRETQQDS